MSTLSTTNLKNPSSASNNIVLDASGNVALQAGAVGTPALYATGDSNTGIWFPAADTAALSTGGSERLRIDSSGRLGIGTSAPGSELEVKGASSSSITIRAASGANLSNILFARDGSSGDTRIRSDVGNNTLEFVTAGSQRAVIDSSGRLGIGTTSPGTSLHCSSGSVDIATFQRSSAGADAALMIVDSNSTGAYINTAGGANVVFATRSAGTNSERCRIDASGRLLVGTSSSTSVSGAAALVQIETGANIGLSLLRRGDVPIFALAATGGSGATVVTNNQSLGQIRFAGADGSNIDAIAAQIQAQVDGTPGANDMPGRLVFSTTADGASSPTERMRIGSDGVTNIFSSGSSNFIPRSAAAANTSNFFIQGCYGATNTQNGTVSFQVFTNGNVQNTNNSYAGISDIKLKENIVNATSQWSDIKALQVRKYNFKEGQTHTQIGLIAQEVELVSPGLVSESPDRDEDGNDLGTVTKSVNYSVLYMKAVKALQEAMERIETLEAKVAALESA